jgi:hypothetical protein
VRFSIMDNETRFRLRADECRRMARKISLRERREFLLSVAEQWDTLADGAEHDRLVAEEIWDEQHPDQAPDPTQRNQKSH